MQENGLFNLYIVGMKNPITSAGELAAYLTGANLVMEYVISNAAVARSFTSNLSAVFGIKNPEAWRVFAHGLAHGYNRLDFPALALVSLMTFFICKRYHHTQYSDKFLTTL